MRHCFCVVVVVDCSSSLNVVKQCKECSFSSLLSFTWKDQSLFPRGDVLLSSVSRFQSLTNYAGVGWVCHHLLTSTRKDRKLTLMDRRQHHQL